MLIGDLVHNALKRVGVTPERVEAWIGQPCGCKERRRRWNALHKWAVKALMGRATVKDLEDILR